MGGSLSLSKSIMKNWRDHQKSMTRAAELKGRCTKIYIQSSWNFDIKPGSTEASGELSPIWARQLKDGTTHRGRQLSGVIIEPAIYTGGIYFVLKDAVGALVKVGVYGIPDADLDVAAQLFKPGECVTVREPYFKVGMDGRAFIRVDDPSSDLHIDSTSILPGTDSVAWQHVGKQFFAASMPAAAIECWNESLCFANATSAVATLLTNRAAALLRASRPAEVARDCGVALIVCPSQVKAAGRLVDALSELKFNEEARKLASAFTKQFPYIKSSLQAPLCHGASHTTAISGQCLGPGPTPSRGNGGGPGINQASTTSRILFCRFCLVHAVVSHHWTT